MTAIGLYYLPQTFLNESGSFVKRRFSEMVLTSGILLAAIRIVGVLPLLAWASVRHLLRLINVALATPAGVTQFGHFGGARAQQVNAPEGKFLVFSRLRLTF